MGTFSFPYEISSMCNLGSCEFQLNKKFLIYARTFSSHKKDDVEWTQKTLKDLLLAMFAYKASDDQLIQTLYVNSLTMNTDCTFQEILQQQQQPCGVTLSLRFIFLFINGHVLFSATRKGN